MSRPNDGNVRRFTPPQDFFLHLCESLVATLYGEVTASDHDSDSSASHRGQKQGGQLLERLAGFNLENYSDIFGCKLLHTRLKIVNVGLGTHE